MNDNSPEKIAKESSSSPDVRSQLNDKKNPTSVGEIVPHANDVLLGRGGKNNQSPGNAKLRMIALELSPYYSDASKKTKPEIANAVVQRIQDQNPPGRFLRLTEKGWVEAEDEVASEKASQCLRDSVASAKKGSSKTRRPKIYSGLRQLAQPPARPLDLSSGFSLSNMSKLAPQSQSLDAALLQHYQPPLVSATVPLSSPILPFQTGIRDVMIRDALGHAELLQAHRREILMQAQAAASVPMVGNSSLVGTGLNARSMALMRSVGQGTTLPSVPPVGLASLNAALGVAASDNTLQRLRESSFFQ